MREGRESLARWLVGSTVAAGEASEKHISVLEPHRMVQSPRQKGTNSSWQLKEGLY